MDDLDVMHYSYKIPIGSPYKTEAQPRARGFSVVAGEYGKDRSIDFAYWANLGGRAVRSDEEYDALLNMLGFHRYQNELSEAGAMTAALIQCENLYRTSCLLAYGNGLAGYCDIKEFAGITEVPLPNDESIANGFDGDTMVCLKAVLPYSKWLDDARIPDALSTPGEYHGILNPNRPSFLYVEHSFYGGEGYQTYEMFCYSDGDTAKQSARNEWREPFKLIGQVIASSLTFSNYVGVFDGKPLFDAKCGFDSLWQAMAELTDKQAPGICPVCGKVIDRRRDGKGGHPKKTCAAHSDKFQNMKKALQKSGNPAMRFSDKCEEAVRQQRWHDASLNERPLTFPAKP